MVFLALNKKSIFPIRLACLGAIALMIISVIISVFVVLTSDTTIVDPSMLIVGEPAAVEEKGDNLFPLLFTIVFFLGLFIMIVVLTMREHKRSDVKKGIT